MIFLAKEKTFRDTINQLNIGFGYGAEVEFEPLGWEDTYASTGCRTQGVINKEIDRCDVFILAMNRRWGQEAPDSKPYLSYTEEEFHRAFERWKKEKKPDTCSIAILIIKRLLPKKWIVIFETM